PTVSVGQPPAGGNHQHETVKLAPVAPAKWPRASVQPAPTRNQPGQPLAPVSGGQLAQPAALDGVAAVVNHTTDPVDLKLLLIAVDGQETDYPAWQAFLKQLGIPFDTLIAPQTTLTDGRLWDGVSHGFYQGIILTTGDLIYLNPSTHQYQTAFTTAEWNTLW